MSPIDGISFDDILAAVRECSADLDQMDAAFAAGQQVHTDKADAYQLHYEERLHAARPGVRRCGDDKIGSVTVVLPKPRLG